MKRPGKLALLAPFLVLARIALAEPETAVVSRIKHEPVVSSNVASVGYSRHLHALEVEFVRGAVYRFLDVPQSVYRKLLASDSKGHFIAEELRGKYQFIRVRPRRMAGSNGHQPASQTASLGK